MERVIGASGAHICELFTFTNIYDQVFATWVFAHNHTAVDFVPWGNKQRTAFLRVCEPVADTFANVIEKVYNYEPISDSFIF